VGAAGQREACWAGWGPSPPACCARPETGRPSALADYGVMTVRGV